MKNIISLDKARLFMQISTMSKSKRSLQLDQDISEILSGSPAHDSTKKPTSGPKRRRSSTSDKEVINISYESLVRDPLPILNSAIKTALPNIDDAEVHVTSIEELKGSADPRNAELMYFTSQSGMKLKFVRIILNDTKVRVEPGALYYMNGNLEMKASTGGGIVKGLFRKATSGESFFVNEIHGTGTVVLEPTFGHFLLHEMEV